MNRHVITRRLLAFVMAMILMLPNSAFATEINSEATTQQTKVTTTKATTATTKTTSTKATTEKNKKTTTTSKVKNVAKKKTTFKGKRSIDTEYTYGYKIPLEITTKSDGKKTFTSSNTKVATVSSKGVVTLRSLGECIITLTTEETDTYKEGEVEIKISSWKSPITLPYSSSYKRGKYYRKLRALKLRDNTVDNILAVANSQVGYHESSSSGNLTGYSRRGGNRTEYGRFYGFNGVAWCAIFVNWVARQNGISYSTIPKYCAVLNYYSYYRRRGRIISWNSARRRKAIPEKGDIIFYSNVYRGNTHHIGYVESITYSGSTMKITTIEGNTSNRVKKVKMNISRFNTRGRINGHYITGFGTPRY